MSFADDFLASLQPAAKPARTRCEPSITLADLQPRKWTTVAVSRVPGAWDWHINDREVGVLRLARENGALLTAQARLAEGVYELKAMLTGARS